MNSVKLDKKQKTVLLIAVAVLILTAIGLIVVLLFEMNNAGNTNSTTDVSETEITTSVQNHTTSESNNALTEESSQNSDNTTKSIGNNKTSQSPTVTSKDHGENDVKSTIPPVPTLGEKTGENYCTDDPDNKYIVTVAAKYRIDPALLVCIYPVNFDGTESDNNYVMQFDGTKKDDGSYMRSPDTLQAVYQVKANEKCIKYTNLDVAGMFVFTMVTDLMMPQHPDVFDGV